MIVYVGGEAFDIEEISHAVDENLAEEVLNRILDSVKGVTEVEAINRICDNLEQIFIDEYIVAHRARFGEEFYVK